MAFVWHPAIVFRDGRLINGWLGSLAQGLCVERVIGIGGVFFKARDPSALAAWYREHLGLPIEMGQTYGTLIATAAGEPTVWSAFPDDTGYFAPSKASFMLNYRVQNLDAMLAQLRAVGAQVDDRIEEYENGRFGWASDPAGNRFELWESSANKHERPTAP